MSSSLLPHDTPPTLGVPAITKITGLSRPTIYKLISDRKLACLRVGRSVRVLRQDLEQFLESARQPAV
jgi:excisionase family DNA binding protein